HPSLHSFPTRRSSDLQPLNSGSCAHWQQGIGASSTGIVSIVQFSVVLRFFNIVWGLSPYDWLSSPPLGIGTFPPTLYEGTLTMNPASVAGCAAPFPTGGYDC